MSYKKMLPLVLAALLLWTVPASAAPETTLKVAVGDPEDSEMGVVGHAFKKYVEEKTGGKVEVQCFYGGSLGDESEAFRNVQKGTLPLAMGGIANLVPFEKKLGLLTLPYLFANIDEVVAGTNGAPAELLNKYATKAGFRILTWTYTDFRYISNSKRPITKMADMQGLKFRVPQSAVLIAAYKAFGGSPTPISWAETFTALQQGVVDGQCYGYIGFKAMKFNEANQKYLTEVHYTYQLQPLVISERVFKKMTPEMQKLIVDAGKYAQDAVLKFRVPQSAVLIAAYKAFGGSPTPISWAETFTALQQGVVDGQCYGYIGFKANKFNEANQKYLTEVHYTYQLQPLVISERVFKKMTPEMQKLLIDAGKYAQEKVLKYQIEQADAAKKYLIDNGLQVSQLEDEDVWKKAAMEKVWPEMADFVGGKETINAYLKACGKPLWK